MLRVNNNSNILRNKMIKAKKMMTMSRRMMVRHRRGCLRSTMKNVTKWTRVYTHKGVMGFLVLQTSRRCLKFNLKLTSLHSHSKMCLSGRMKNV